MFITIFLSGFTLIIYTFCEYMTRFFAQQTSQQATLGLLFQIVIIPFRMVVWRASQKYDFRLAGCRADHMWVFLVHVFFFVFFRVLFSEVHSLQSFVILQVEHVLFELFSYWLVMQGPVFRLYYGAQQYVLIWLRLASNPKPPMQYTDEEWQIQHRLAFHRMCIEYMLRLCASTMSTLNFFVINLILRYVPYLTCSFALTQTADFGPLSLYLCLSSLVEFALFFVLEYYYRTRHNLTPWAKWREFLSNRKHFIFIGFCVSHIFTDVPFGLLKLSFQS
eukprot:TRINITY_DN10248_c0_g1_i7.p1 TRINITY_DN10248_c0_g1~~TRINITY_DN10248_c0_g1_i7.p1  ORF type:complete len:277 (-),score=28.36 TRINITY_DN10248_c0_g1_i7:66-896(-)